MPKPCREGEGSPGVGVEGKREQCTEAVHNDDVHTRGGGGGGGGMAHEGRDSVCG